MVPQLAVEDDLADSVVDLVLGTFVEKIKLDWT